MSFLASDWSTFRTTKIPYSISPSICFKTLTNGIPDRERLREYEEEMKKREQMESEVKELEKYDKYARSCHYMMSTQVVCVYLIEHSL